jgi:predicted metal-dependent peptidase
MATVVINIGGITLNIEEMDDSDEKYDLFELNRELDRTKSKLFMGSDAAFLAPLMCSLEFRWTYSIPTAATDGLTIWWNPVDFMGCTERGRVSSLLHELGHVMRLHNVRRGDRKMDDWNKAGDIAINRGLIKEGYGIDGWKYPGLGETPECPFEVEEDIYDWLQSQCAPAPKGNTPGLPGQGAGQPQQGPGGTCTCSGVFTPAGGSAGAQQVANNVVGAISAADQAKNPGSVPGRVREIIKKFLEPVVPWETVVLRWLVDKLDRTWTWRRPNRRYRHAGIYLPSRFTDDKRLQHVMCFEDVSGSVGEKESIRFNSELKYLWERFKPKKLTIVQFDTKIQKVDVLSEGDVFAEIEIIGRGGTCLKEVRQMIIDEKPDAVIIFTDMYVTPMEELPHGVLNVRDDLLWIAVDNKAAEVPFGRLIHIKA